LNNLCITEETVSNHGYVTKQINASFLSTNIKLM